MRDAIDEIDARARGYQRALAEKAPNMPATVMPGFTHLQTAQPVTFGHHLLAYVEMAARDRGRFADARTRLNESPLGAAALAGTSFPIDRTMTAEALGFDRPMANSLDAVADRDFALEMLAAAAICGHASLPLRRGDRDLVLAAVGFVRLSDRFTTGSSIMPQKRNPDAAELVRAKAGRIVGALVALLMVMKGLPLAYAKDMQEDKEGAFDALAALSLALAAMTGMVRDMEPDAERMRAAAGAGYSTATDLADWLVRELGLPFREAHHVTGRIVARRPRRGVPLDEAARSRRCRRSIRGSPRGLRRCSRSSNSVASRTSYGGTAPRECARAGAALARRRLGTRRRRRWLRARCWRSRLLLIEMRSGGRLRRSACRLAMAAVGRWPPRSRCAACGRKGPLDRRRRAAISAAPNRRAPPAEQPPRRCRAGADRPASGLTRTADSSPSPARRSDSARPARCRAAALPTAAGADVAAGRQRRSTIPVGRRFTARRMLWSKADASFRLSRRRAARRGGRLPRSPRRSARRSTAIRRATLTRHYRVFGGAFAGVRRADLLRDEGQFQPGGAAHARLARRRHGRVSEGELGGPGRRAFRASKIVFSGVGKTRDEMALALEDGILCVNVE